MKSKNLTLGIIGLLALAACEPMTARAAYDDLGVSPRVVGLGNAFTAVADDAYAIYYNPAGLATLDRPEAVASYAKLVNGLSDNSSIQNSFLGFEHPIAEGREGTAGVALNYFSLQGLYQETSLYGSYGRELLGSYYPDKLYGGLSLKLLNRTLSPGGVASNGLGNTGIAMGSPDPVLQHTSKTNLDVDWGLLYRVQPRWTLGLAVQHFLEPNIAFSPDDTDRLGRNVKLGAAYHTPFSLLSMDLDFPTAPDGSIDKNVAIAAEKWLPTLLYGTVGLRGSLAAGTRDFRQIGLGISYKIFRMQFDYGFTMPLGGLATSGSHRMGLTWRFGSSRAPQATMGQAILENIRDLADVGTPEFRYQMEDLTLFKRTAIEEFSRQAKVDVGSGKFADALAKLNEIASLKPGDAKVAESQARLKIVADVYPEVKEFYTEPGQAAIYDGALKFLSGKDQDALGNLAYAQSLNTGDARIETLMKAIEAKSGLKRAPVAAPELVPVAVATAAVATTPVPAPVPAPAPTSAPAPVAAQAGTAVSSAAAVSAAPAPAPAPVPAPAPAPVPAPAPAPVAPSAEEAAAAHVKQLVEGYMALMEVAFRQFEYDKVIQLAKQVVELDEANVLAYKRMGAAYHALKRYPQALSALESAFKYEKDGAARKNLRSYINALAAAIKRGQTVAAKPAARPKPAALSPGDVEKLYETGVDLYSRGRLTEAAAAFREILELDPNDIAARKALRRVEAETVQSGETR